MTGFLAEYYIVSLPLLASLPTITYQVFTIRKFVFMYELFVYFLTGDSLFYLQKAHYFSLSSLFIGYNLLVSHRLQSCFNV